MRFVRCVLMLICALSLYACNPADPNVLTAEPTEATPEPPLPTPIPDAAAATAIPENTAESATHIPTPAARLLLIGAAPSPDGQLIAVVDDRGMQVHRVGSWDVLWRAPLEGMISDLRQNQVQIVWTPDSQTVTAAVSHDIYSAIVEMPFATYVSRFDARTGELRWQHTFPTFPYVWFAPDGNHMVLIPTNHSNEAIRPPAIWDGKTQTQTGTLELPERGDVWWLLKQNWSPDGSMIAGTVSVRGQVTQHPEGGLSADNVFNPPIYVWDAVTGKMLATMIHPHQRQGSQKLVLWSPDGTRLITAEEDCFIFWDTGTWKYRYEILTDPKYNWVGNLTLSPDGTRLLSFLYYITTMPEDIPPSFGWWNVQNLQELAVDPALQAMLPEARDSSLLGWTPDGQTLVFRIAKRIMFFDIQSGALTEKFTLPFPDYAAWWQPPNRGEFYLLSPDAEYIYMMQPMGIAVYDADTGEVIGEMRD